MMLFWNAALVFLAVPKTGTQAYQAALGDTADMVIRHPAALKHVAAQRFRNRLRPFLDPEGCTGLATIAVIREPRDWLGSWFRYRGRAQLAGHPNATHDITFEQFVAAWLQDTPPPFAAVGSQARFVSNARGKLLVDHLFAYEDPAPLHRFLEARLGRRIDVARQNVSPDRPLDLPAALEDRLRTERAADFDLHAAVRAGRHLPG